MKKIIAMVCCFGIFGVLLSGCSKNGGTADMEIIEDDYASMSFGKSNNVDFDAPVEGESILVIEYKDYGTIKFRLFNDVAPKGVENFVNLVQEGYYDGLTMHRIMDDFMMQGGDPTGTGTGGESFSGEGFGYEVDENVRHFAGALAYAHSALPDSNGSQFYVVCSAPAPDDDTTYQNAAMMQEYAGYEKSLSFPENVRKKYAEVGGVPSLDGGYTVFGQLYEGQDVVDKICKEASNPNDPNGTASKKVIIEKAYMSKYKA